MTHTGLVESPHISIQPVTFHSDQSNYCKAVGKMFLPLVVETFGAWDLGAIKVLKKIAGRAAPRKGTDYSVEVKFLFQKPSVALRP